ncbi:PH domain-containing protein [Stieleria sp. TO1_6]|uniref:PH domain-containing protein n=1 Tax=Stieleria tagensis TaxID=2956795 RepID=UPI00209A6ADA|nr:PH domain-containing protein [Stieleria tagensis]MCO8120909.1 PH domain-containing protein [Stieleria tagensis]
MSIRLSKLLDPPAMQVLTTHCPYCKHQVDSTIEHIDGPVVCPGCKKPFEIEMPTAVVSSVNEVDETKMDKRQMAAEPEERTLLQVHPVVFRARPIKTLVLGTVFLVAAALMILSVTETSIAGYSFAETTKLGPASLLTWACAITLLLIVGTVGYWILLSQFTTLTVTSDRTIFQKGLIARETSEVQHDDVRNIQLDQTFLQRMLGVGGIGISSSGQDDLEVVAKRLPHPEHIIDRIRQNQG